MSKTVPNLDGETRRVQFDAIKLQFGGGEKIRDAFEIIQKDDTKTVEEANKNGKKVKIADESDSCNEQRKQCNIDRIIYHATPEGEVEKSRFHTY